MSNGRCRHCNYPYIKRDFCPNCGSKSPTSSGSGFGIFLIIIIIIILNQKSDSPEPNPSEPTDFSNSKSIIDTTTDFEDHRIEESETKDKIVLFHNETNEKIYLAYGYYNENEKKWQSTGWFNIESNNEFSISLPNTFLETTFYWYTISESGIEKEGDSYFCIDQTNPFNYMFDNVDECNSISKGFNKADLSYVQNIIKIIN
jgi:uncharacterized membrane protein